MRDAGRGSSGEWRGSRRATPRPHTRNVVASARDGAREASRARPTGGTSRSRRGYRFARDDREDSTSREGAARPVAEPDRVEPRPVESSGVAEPARSKRPRAARRRWPWLVGALAVLALAAGLVWALLFSSLFAARAVQVVGVSEVPPDVVRAVAAVPLGTPMPRLDTTAIERRVAAVPRVASVRVRCTLDGMVRIEVTERTPVALVRRGSAAHLVDATGTDYATVPIDPPGLPELKVDTVGPRDEATVAALKVLATLPRWLRDQLRSITARSAGEVVLRLADGHEVRWGDATDGDRKAAVLRPLLTQPGEVYDVSSPALPTIS